MDEAFPNGKMIGWVRKCRKSDTTFLFLVLLTNTPLFLLRQNDLFLKTQLLTIENIVTFPQLCIDSTIHSSQSWSKEWINRLKQYEDYYDPLFFLSPKWLLAQFKTYCLLKYWDFPLRTCLNKRFFINWGRALRIDWLKMMIKWRINIFSKKYFLNHLTVETRVRFPDVAFGCDNRAL